MVDITHICTMSVDLREKNLSLKDRERLHLLDMKQVLLEANLSWLDELIK